MANETELQFIMTQSLESMLSIYQGWSANFVDWFVSGGLIVFGWLVYDGLRSRIIDSFLSFIPTFDIIIKNIY